MDIDVEEVVALDLEEVLPLIVVRYGIYEC